MSCRTSVNKSVEISVCDKPVSESRSEQLLSQKCPELDRSPLQERPQREGENYRAALSTLSEGRYTEEAETVHKTQPIQLYIEWDFHIDNDIRDPSLWKCLGNEEHGLRNKEIPQLH